MYLRCLQVLSGSDVMYSSRLASAAFGLSHLAGVENGDA
jgi:hypothetical protein